MMTLLLVQNYRGDNMIQYEIDDVSKVIECNAEWIFLKGDIRVPATQEKLYYIYTTCSNDSKYYDRAYQELSEYHDRLFEEYKKKPPIPTPDEIAEAKDLLIRIELKLRKENRLRELSQINGIAMSRDYMRDMRNHCNKLIIQAKPYIK